MNRFGALLDDLASHPEEADRMRLVEDYLRQASDPDRGAAVALLCGTLPLPTARAATVRALGTARLDEKLFALSSDYVGDAAEALTLAWQPAPGRGVATPALSDVVDKLRAAARRQIPDLVADLFDRLDVPGRQALLRLIGGPLRTGLSGRHVRMALADASGVPLAAIEEIWHGVEPPYADMIDWLFSNGPMPQVDAALSFRPAMPLVEADLATLEQLDPTAFHAEWLWEGARVLVAVSPGGARLYSDEGQEIGGQFPEIVADLRSAAVLDGLLPGTSTNDGSDAGRPRISLSDMLFEGDDDLRHLPVRQRRRRLEQWLGRQTARAFDLAAPIDFSTWADLARVRAAAPRGTRGLLLKRHDSTYDVAGNPWLAWLHDRACVDAVVMYARQGHGGPRTLYPELTLGCWRIEAGGRRILVPVARVDTCGSEDELERLDEWIQSHLVNRFGPVHEVAPGLVARLSFDAVLPSKRHKARLTLRSPILRGLKWQAAPEEAADLSALEGLIG